MIHLPSSQGICFCQELLLILADKKALLHFVCHHLTMFIHCGLADIFYYYCSLFNSFSAWSITKQGHFSHSVYV